MDCLRWEARVARRKMPKIGFDLMFIACENSRPSSFPAVLAGYDVYGNVNMRPKVPWR